MSMKAPPTLLCKLRVRICWYLVFCITLIIACALIGISESVHGGIIADCTIVEGPMVYWGFYGNCDTSRTRLDRCICDVIIHHREF